MSTPEALQRAASSLQHTTRQSVAELFSKDEPITVGDYLLTRLSQLGVKSMFGLPGDFNLGFLDLVEDHESIEWVGNCNELNAAYAADGYARVHQNSIGVITTTFGVGELSAINGIAGAFSEHIPILHIVGVPSTVQQKNRPVLHHTLGDGRFDAYTKAAEQFTVAQTNLMNLENAASEIDRVLTQCITAARPVYLTLPTDIAKAKISSDGLKTPLVRHTPPNDPGAESFVLDEIVKLVELAEGKVVVLVDACTIRHDVKDEVHDLLAKTHYPVFSAPMGKTAVNESYERYGGIFCGALSRPDILETVKTAKLILYIGAIKSDFNTGNWSYTIPDSAVVELHSDHTQVQFARFPSIGMKHLLPRLTERLKPFKPTGKITVPRTVEQAPPDPSTTITHDFLWPTVGGFFGKKDIIVAETGTSSFGILDVPFPDDSIFVSQILWGSIGWTVGSTLGAALAAKQLGLGRTILFVGDGSLQLTVQEISVMIRSGLTPIIFVLNNKGYTIERYLHGKTRKYNDISNWKWTTILSTLGGVEGQTCQSYTVGTKQELTTLLNNATFAKADKIQLVEILMEWDDAPRALKRQAQLSAV
ncbi:pyruvate decarboxylase [Sistotremastrum suecicum HHB10207 ss-3]|uniref:Pyruvate decarboxylase n=1 Tax=Sistotremastrum suecicum HHB10207 ss-3 TaxID=1314776 RepID=A0A166HES3_9AGAM|nr:pyruvate decarboxylase [Sistotremastrum suecicum HHB10207 ss-3]